MYRILIIDDHSLVRDGIRMLLGGLGEPPQLFEAGSCEEGLQALPDLPPLDLVLLDLGLPGTGGMAGIPLFRRALPTTPIIIISASESSTDARDALTAGARGFVPKSSVGEVILSAIRLVLAGSLYVPPTLMLDDLPAQTPGRPLPLTPRQIEVLTLLAQGMTNKAIGQLLHMAESTVRVHTTAIFKALEVSNRTEAALIATRLGFIPTSAVATPPG